MGASNTDGSTANLRGLGSDKTLVLLNGRRLAANPFGTSTVNLNIIPLAMIDRIEVLRDGASAVYGADAVAGLLISLQKHIKVWVLAQACYNQNTKVVTNKIFLSLVAMAT